MTMTDLVSGRITSFRREQGFGVITLDDGTQVKFDAGICNKMQIPEEGAAVRLRVGPAKWGGGLKALYVEPVMMPTFLDAPPPRSLEDQLAAVQREHLVSGLSENVMDDLIARHFGGRTEAATILQLLDAYYTADPERARSDGYFRRGAEPLRHGDVLAEIAELLPGAKLPRQVRWLGGAPREEAEVATAPYEKIDLDALLDAGDASGKLLICDPDGRERPVDVASINDLVELVNAALRREGDRRRVYRLRTGGDWHAYLALAGDRALRLASTLPFEPAPASVA
jgi:cold shock CspA family protein